MEMPTVNHVFYIPLILAIGVLFGHWWGRRTLMIRLAEEERAQRLRQQRRDERRARMDATASTSSLPDADQAASDDKDS